MVLSEDLGNDLGDEFVIVNVVRKVHFLEEIQEKLAARPSVVLKGWGKGIILAVKLALQSVGGSCTNAREIGNIRIGTEEHVQVRTKGEKTGTRVTKSLSWIEIPVYSSGGESGQA